MTVIPDPDSSIRARTSVHQEEIKKQTSSLELDDSWKNHPRLLHGGRKDLLSLPRKSSQEVSTVPGMYIVQYVQAVSVKLQPDVFFHCPLGARIIRYQAEDLREPGVASERGGSKSDVLF